MLSLDVPCSPQLLMKLDMEQRFVTLVKMRPKFWTAILIERRRETIFMEQRAQARGWHTKEGEPEGEDSSASWPREDWDPPGPPFRLAEWQDEGN
jgi:hypothetical protein